VAIERSILCSGVKYLAFETLGSYYLRMAKKFFMDAEKRIDAGHSKHDYITKIISFLNEYAPSLLKISQEDLTINVELPNFPYDRIEDIDKWKGILTHVGDKS
jgi:hypothetical protein